MNTHDNPSILIVDDEQDACRNLQRMIQEHHPDVRIVGIAHNTTSAEKLINELKPDAVFLDIEMPGENALQFLERITPHKFEIIFVTAYDEFAIRALRLNAIDYILKPININELSNAYFRLKDRLQHAVYPNHLDGTDIYNQFTQRKQPEKIILKGQQEMEVISFKDICYIEAEGSYSKFYFMKQGVVRTMLMSNYIAEYEALLPNNKFCRIHKSYLVNFSYVNKILKDHGGAAVLKNGQILPVSRRRYTEVYNFFRQTGVEND